MTDAAVVTVGDLSADAVLVAFAVAHPTEGLAERLWEHARAEAALVRGAARLRAHR